MVSDLLADCSYLGNGSFPASSLLLLSDGGVLLHSLIKAAFRKHDAEQIQRRTRTFARLVVATGFLATSGSAVAAFLPYAQARSSVLIGIV